MTADARWLESMWPRVRSFLPAPPAMVVDLGCGTLGGFVPMLLESGYEALGVDPRAPEGGAYRQVEFEHAELDLGGRADAIVASTSLHHVADPAEVLDKVADSVASGGLLIVLEWDWESFDEPTARWCFERLAPSGPDDWLHRARERWTASGQPWPRYIRSWAEEHGIHPARSLVPELDRRFERIVYERGPYFFPVTQATDADELEAIDAGRIRANRIDYVGRRP